MDTLNIYLPSLKFVALRVPEIIGGTQKIWAVTGYAHAPFSPNSWACVRMEPANMPAKFEVPSFSLPEIIAIAVLGWGCEPQSRGRVGRRGSGMVPFERAFVTSYRLSIVTFPLSLRVSELLPLLCSSTLLFPTPPVVSPNFPMFPWE